MFPPKPQQQSQAPQSRATALDMLETEHGIDPQMRNPMSGADTSEVFVDKSLLPTAKEGQEVTGRFSVGKIGSKISLKPIEFMEEGNGLDDMDNGMDVSVPAGSPVSGPKA